jgi:phosphoribosylformylglycinamidine cyclo-ligase
LLQPSKIYARAALTLATTVEVHAFSHVTGGGLAANVARVLPAEFALDIERPTWAPPPVFDLIGTLGGVARSDLEATFNQGIGMLALVPAAVADLSLATLRDRGVAAWVCGTVRDRAGGESGDAPAKGGKGGAVSLVGEHRTRDAA